MSDLTQFAEQFQAFETRQRLFTRRYLGKPYWDYIRVPIYETMVSRKRLRTELVPPSTVLPGSKWRRLVRDAWHIARYAAWSLRHRAVHRRQYDFILFDIANRWQVNGQWINIINDPLIRHYHQRYALLLLNPAPLAELMRDRYPCPAVSIRGLHLLARLLARGWPLSTKIVAECAALRSQLVAEFGVEMDVGRYLRAHYLWQRIMAALLARRLRRYRPKAILWLNDFQRYVIQAARDAGIPIVELQHGATDELDMNTSYGPAVTRTDVPTMPDAIFTFGAYWNKKFRSPTQKIVVGCPFFETQVAAARRRGITRNPRMVLGISVMDPTLLDGLYHCARSAPACTVYYKLRPEEYATWRQIVPAAIQQQPNLIVIDTDRKPLIEYLCVAQYVISTCSTVLYEGIYCGAYPLVYSGWYHEMMADILEAGWALPVRDGAELTEIVTKRTIPSVRPDPHQFYADRGLERLAQVLDTLAERTYVTHPSVAAVELGRHH